jgi:hypothetical protein
MEDLLGFAEEVFRLRRPGPDGTSQEQNLRQVARQKKLDEDEFVAQYYDFELPPGGEFIFEVYYSLAAARTTVPTATGAVTLPIGYADIAAWAQLHHVDFAAWEIRALLGIDRKFFEVMDSGRSGGTGTQDKKHERGTGAQAPGEATGPR